MTRFSAVAMIALAGTLATAQPTGDGGSDSLPDSAPSKWTLSLTFEGEAVESADFDDVGGDISATSIRGRFDAIYKLDETHRLILGFGVGQTEYDLDGVTGLVPGAVDPFDTVEEYEVRAGVMGKYQEKWNWAVIGRVRSEGESSADFSDTLQYGGVFSLAYQVNPKLSVGGSLLVMSSLEDDVRIIPLPVINWKIDEDTWSIATSDAGVQLLYKSSETLLIRATLLSFSVREFRLDEKGPLPSGVIRETRVGLGVGADWNPKPKITVSGMIGAYPFMEYESFNSSGDDIADDETDAPLFITFGVTFRF